MLELISYTEAAADAYQNRKDLDLEKFPKSVKYVFDSDIVELFVRPSEYIFTDAYRKNASRKFIFDWGIDSKNFAADVVSQHALVTGEYLLSATLPGSDGKFYFTPWHDTEVSSQFKYISSSLVAARSTIEEGIRAKIERYRESVERLDSKQGIRAMQEITAALANDTKSEPFEQLGRLAAILRGAGRIINDEIEIPAVDWKSIKEEKENWFNRLSNDTKKEHDRIERDAMSLALLRYVSNNSPPGKILFITGDNRLFRTYRDWYFRSRADEPFFMRRMSQYTPLINTHAIASDLGGTQNSRNVDLIFERIENILDGTIFKLTDKISRPIANQTPENGKLFGAAHFRPWRVERLIKSKRISHRLLGTKDIAELDQIQSAIEETRKQALGAFSKLTSNRLNPVLASRVNSLDKEKFYQEVKKYVEDALIQVEKQALSFVQNSDKNVIYALYRLGPKRHRIPDTLMYKIGGQTLAEIVRNLDRETERRNDPLSEVKSFIDVRAFGAAVALSTHSWSEAKHYAGSALSLAKQQRHYPKEYRWELIFLLCLTRRYQMAHEIGRHKGPPLGRKKMDEANDILMELDSLVLLSRNDEYSSRAISEIAALHLFKCCIEFSLGTGDELHSMTSCLEELQECHELLTRNGVRSAKIKNSVRSQILHNCASCLLLLSLVDFKSGPSNSQKVEWREILSADFFTLTTEYAKLHKNDDQSTFLKFELFFFLYLTAQADITSDAIRAIISESRADENLEIDEFVLAVADELIQHPRHADFHGFLAYDQPGEIPS